MARLDRNGFQRDQEMWKGAVAGAVAGVAASWVMSQFQAGLGKAAESGKSGRAQPKKQNTSSQQQPEGDDATMKTADAIAETVLDRHLSKAEKRTAGPLVHYAFGTTVGALYGAVAEIAPVAATAWGLPYAAAVWVGADEVMVPALGLSKSPREYPASTHASALAAHLVYGFTTDLVRRAVRARR